jgi:hypothetical protein
MSASEPAMLAALVWSSAPGCGLQGGYKYLWWLCNWHMGCRDDAQWVLKLLTA